MRGYLISLIVAILFTLSGCKKERRNSPINQKSSEYSGWTVPIEDLIISDDAWDRIHPIDTTAHLHADSAMLDLDSWVFVFSHHEQSIAYPLTVLGRHEIVNDKVADAPVSITYCPLTGSALVIEGQLGDGETSFGVSGHLYLDNLVPYDRLSGSYWSQMAMEGVRGKYAGESIKSKQLILTNWKTAREADPHIQVLSHSANDHGCDSVCNRPGTYHNSFNQHTLGTFGVIQKNNALLFDYYLFTDSVMLYQLSYRGESLVVVGSVEKNLIVSFLPKSAAVGEQFEAVQNEFPILWKDELGNKIDVFGHVVEGPSMGSRLAAANGYFAYPFAWKSFFPEHEFYRP